MDALGRAIYARIVGDGFMDAALARSVIEPTDPAVYTTDKVPHNAAMPYIHAPFADVASLNEDVLHEDDGGYRRVARDVAAYDAHPDDGGGDAEPVQAVAERIRALFHRQPLVLAGEQVCRDVRATGPIVNDGINAYGRVVTLACLLAEPVGA